MESYLSDGEAFHRGLSGKGRNEDDPGYFFSASEALATISAKKCGHVGGLGTQTKAGAA